MKIKELSKNLKVGDIFIDGDRLLKIDKVIDEGVYESHQITEDETGETSEGMPEAEPGTEADKTEEVAEVETDEKAKERKKLEKLNRAELVEIAEAQGKSGEGLKKAELIELIVG